MKRKRGSTMLSQRPLRRLKSGSFSKVYPSGICGAEFRNLSQQ